MVIPTQSESGAEVVTSGAVGQTASMPIPTPTPSMPNHNHSSKLSSSAPSEKLIGFDLFSSSPVVSSNSQGISSYSEAGSFMQRASLQASGKGVAEEGRKEPEKQNMDLEQCEPKGKGRRKFTTDPDLPPHLSEYSERNVIAIMNRCDPESGRRCFSCGYDTQKWMSSQGMNGYYGGHAMAYDDEPYSLSCNYTPRQSQQECTEPAWNYYFFDSDSGYANPSCNYNYYHHHQQQPGGEEGRGRLNSDGGSSDNAMDEEVFTFDVSKEMGLLRFLHSWVHMFD